MELSLSRISTLSQKQSCVFFFLHVFAPLIAFFCVCDMVCGLICPDNFSTVCPSPELLVTFTALLIDAPSFWIHRGVLLQIRISYDGGKAFTPRARRGGQVVHVRGL